MNLKHIELDKFYEIQDYLFLTMKYGIALIIPKHKIDNTEEIKDLLNRIATNQKIQFDSNLKWRWR
ncbi:MAG TPA: hypothetical protein VNV85_17170 [Puia sp.]|nr:hypothetical protein [Puia sp.]